MDSSQALPTPASSNELDTNTPTVYIKQAPDDDTTERTVTAPSEMASSLKMLSDAAATAAATEPYARQKSSEELIAIIHNLQASHAQQLAELREQQAALSSQLDQMKSILNTYLTSQLGSIHLLQSKISSLSTPNVVPRPPITPASSVTVPSQRLPQSSRMDSSPKLPCRPPIRPAPISIMEHSPAVSSQPLSQISTTNAISTPTPNHAHATQDALATPTAATPSPTQLGSSATPGPIPHGGRSELRIEPAAAPNEPPIVHASHIDTVAEVWEEFRYGRAGNMSVERLDAVWGPRWRQDHRLRVWYQRRKLIADRIKLYMADGIDEKDAVAEVEKMRRGRSLNWVSRILGEDAKETRKQRKVAAQAATAARMALLSGYLPTA